MIENEYIEDTITKKHIFDTNKLIDAVLFATSSHATQKRKFSDDPYVLHPMRVAKLTLFYTGCTNLMIPALLHDVIEDTKVTVNEIKDRFGIIVANIVSNVSDDKLDVKKAPSKGIFHFEKIRKFLRNGDYDSIILKLCDRLDNMIDAQNNFIDTKTKNDEFQNAGHHRLMVFLHSDLHYKLMIEDIRKMCKLMVFNTRFILNFLFIYCNCKIVLNICRDIEKTSDNLLKIIKE